MLLVNVQACVCMCVFTQGGVRVYIHVCALVSACAPENIKYKQHYMFSVYSIAPL